MVADERVSAELALRAVVEPAFNAPAETNVSPEYELLPESVSVPDPLFVRDPVPVMLLA